MLVDVYVDCGFPYPANHIYSELQTPFNLQLFDYEEDRSVNPVPEEQPSDGVGFYFWDSSKKKVYMDNGAGVVTPVTNRLATLVKKVMSRAGPKARVRSSRRPR